VQKYLALQAVSAGADTYDREMLRYQARVALNYVSTISRGDPTPMRQRRKLVNMLTKRLKHLEMESTGDASPPRRGEELANKLVGLPGAVATCKSSFMWLRRWARKIIGLQRSEDVLPVTTSTVGPSDEPIPVTDSAATSDSDEPPAPVNVPSESWGWCLSCLCSFFNFLKNSFGIAVGFAYFLRDWSYQVIGVTSNQVHTQFDCPLLISCKFYGYEVVVICCGTNIIISVISNCNSTVQNHILSCGVINSEVIFSFTFNTKAYLPGLKLIKSHGQGNMVREATLSLQTSRKAPR
jgi:hypothetical protein